MHEKREKGAITLEACVSVFMFLILMLLLAGLFKLFIAQNVTAHVLLQTSQSLSLDAYMSEELGTEDIGSVGDFIKKLFVGVSGTDHNFVAYEKCYDEDSGQVHADEIKKRFVGYLTGGDESAADDFLKDMKVADGLSGLDFSKSYVENNTLHLVLQYELEYDANIWEMDNVEVQQTTCSKLWKNLE